MTLHPTDDHEFKTPPGTDLEIKITDGEIRVIGTENDLDLMLPALHQAFIVERESRRYRRRDEPGRETVYLTITGIRE